MPNNITKNEIEHIYSLIPSGISAIEQLMQRLENGQIDRIKSILNILKQQVKIKIKKEDYEDSTEDWIIIK